MFEFDASRHKTADNPGYGPCCGKVIKPFGPDLEVTWADGETTPIPRRKVRIAIPLNGHWTNKEGKRFSVKAYTSTGVILVEAPVLVEVAKKQKTTKKTKRKSAAATKKKEAAKKQKTTKQTKRKKIAATRSTRSATSKIHHWNYMCPKTGKSMPTSVRIPGPAWDICRSQTVLVARLAAGHDAEAYVILDDTGKKRGKCHLRRCEESDADASAQPAWRGWKRLNHVAPLPPRTYQNIQQAIVEAGGVDGADAKEFVESIYYKFVERVAQVYADQHDDDNDMHEDRDSSCAAAIQVMS